MVGTLYDEVLDDVYNNSGSTETYKTLLDDYIQPYLINAVLADFIVTNQYKMTNKGLLRLNDNSATSVTSEELEYFKNHFDDIATQHKSNLVQYLMDNNLLQCKTSTNETSGSIGWFLCD